MTRKATKTMPALYEVLDKSSIMMPGTWCHLEEVLEIAIDLLKKKNQKYEWPGIKEFIANYCALFLLDGHFPYIANDTLHKTKGSTAYIAITVAKKLSNYPGNTFVSLKWVKLLLHAIEKKVIRVFTKGDQLVVVDSGGEMGKKALSAFMKG